MNNTINVVNCTFIRNKCNYTLTAGTGGGGMRLGHYVYNFNYDPKGRNQINVTSMSNSAMYGGGLSISPTLQDTSLGGEP